MDPPNPSSQAACAKPSPMETIYSGITQNSFTLVQQGLDIFASSRKGLTSRVLDRTLNLAIKRAKPGIVRYLLDETDCSVAGLSWFHVGFAATTKGNGAGEWGFECEVEDVIAVLEVLVEKGLDVNKAYINTVNDWQNPPYLIYQICSSHELIRWCLNHGAHVAYPDVELHTPLLNHVAQSKSGTLRSFELLLDHGAKLGRRTLHLAAMKAAAAASEDLEGKMEIVRFLVEEMSCDVNAMDVLEGEKYPHHWGTPLNYVVRASGYSNVGQESVEIVARYLLEQGANPYIKDCSGFWDAFELAKSENNSGLYWILDEWEPKEE